MKTLHILCALLSIIGFTYRSFLKIYAPDKLQNKWLKITPHIIDTILLVSAIALVFQYQYYPEFFNWVSAKIVALVVYIGFGLMTLRFSRSRSAIILFYLLSLITFIYILAVANTKQVWPLML